VKYVIAPHILTTAPAGGDRSRGRVVGMVWSSRWQKTSLHHTGIECWFPCYPVCGPVSLNYEYNISQAGSTGLEPPGHGAAVTGSSPAVGGGCQPDLPPHYIVSIIDIYCECFQQDHIPGKETQRHLVGWQEVFITFGSYIVKHRYDETISFPLRKASPYHVKSQVMLYKQYFSLGWSYYI
jgi:hypothetical protein